MALQLNISLPLAARDAFYIVEMESRPTPDELDRLPQELVDTVLLYKAVKKTIEYGLEMDV